MIDWDILKCRHGCDPQRHPVVGIYHAPQGCICWDDPVQALCIAHAVKGQQNNDMSPIIEREGVAVAVEEGVTA